MTRVRAILVAVLVFSGGAMASAEIIDRVVAVVAGQVITKSDVDAAVALGMAGNLQELIDRMLMLNEVRRVAPPEPTATDVQARLARMRARFASPAAFARMLAASGLE